MKNETYTLIYNGTINSMKICGKTFNSPSNNSLITVETLRDNTLFANGENITDLMLIESDIINGIKGLEIEIRVIGMEQPVFGKGGRK